MLKELFYKMAAKRHTYDFSPMPVDKLMSHKGFKVHLDSMTYVLSKYPGSLGWEIGEIDAALKQEGLPVTDENRVMLYHRESANDSPIERQMLNYGTRVAYFMGKTVPMINGVRVIGAESKLNGRDEKRGVNDVDLAIDTDDRPTLFDQQTLADIREGAEKKTGKRVDVILNTFPLNEEAIEHLFAIFDVPLEIRGFPVYWRDKGYLDNLLTEKKNYFDRVMKTVL